MHAFNGSLPVVNECRLGPLVMPFTATLKDPRQTFMSGSTLLVPPLAIYDEASVLEITNSSLPTPKVDGESIMAEIPRLSHPEAQNCHTLIQSNSFNILPCDYYTSPASSPVQNPENEHVFAAQLCNVTLQTNSPFDAQSLPETLFYDDANVPRPPEGPSAHNDHCYQINPKWAGGVEPQSLGFRRSTPELAYQVPLEEVRYSNHRSTDIVASSPPVYATQSDVQRYMSSYMPHFDDLINCSFLEFDPESINSSDNITKRPTSLNAPPATLLQRDPPLHITSDKSVPYHATFPALSIFEPLTSETVVRKRKKWIWQPVTNSIEVEIANFTDGFSWRR